MTEQKYFVKTLTNEIPVFERVFDALPDKPAEWSAHPKNKNTVDLATSMFFESTGYPVFLKTGVVDSDMPMPPKPDKMKKISHDFVKNLEEARDMANKMDEDDWNSPAEMKIKGKTVWKSTKGEMAWGLLIDLIHHRGQLSTHIRPHGGKVPSIYGPSGDDKMGM
jgi:hypothetical protein